MSMLEAAPTEKVSVVIPVFNEQESLPELIRRISNACEELGKNYEILLIDDDSNSHSVQLMMDVSQAPNNRIVSILLNRSYRQHSVIMADFDYVTGDLIITLDADLQDPPEEIPRSVATVGEGFNVIGTVHQDRQDSIFRKTASRMISHLTQRTTGEVMGDYGCMLHAYRRHIVDAMPHYQERSTFTSILVNVSIRRATEILVHYVEREFGDSKYSSMRLINLMYDLVTCLAATPLRMLSLLGGVIAAAGFTLSVLLVVLRLILDPQWAAGKVFMLFVVLLAFIGVQLIGMGLLGEYVGRIYNDVRARPRCFVQHVIRP